MPPLTKVTPCSSELTRPLIGLGPELIELATEVNQFKIDRLTPGTHIPIKDENQISKEPDYYLLLAWNYLDFFRSKYSNFLKNGGKFIVPHPEVKIISK